MIMKKILTFFDLLGAYVFHLIEVARVILFKRPSWPLFRDALYEIGVLSLPVVTVTGLSTGMVLAAQAFFQLSDKGLTGTTGLMITKSMLVELGPLLTAFMITGRSGAAICAQLGTMRVTEQIDALYSMAVNPLYFLVAPRVVAMAFMTPLLTIYSAAMGIFGGFLVSVDVYGMSPESYFSPIPHYVTFFDPISGLIKAFVFGLLISTIACFQGLRTRGGAQGVGKATTSSVVITYSAILIANFILTVGIHAFYFLIRK
jgi:phospholipid/cholesterol/gamma-HCH transport system permease protein